MSITLVLLWIERANIVNFC